MEVNNHYYPIPSSLYKYKMAVCYNQNVQNNKHVGMVLGTATNRSFLSCRKSTVDREALPWKTLNDAICCLTLQCAHAMA